MLGGTDLTQRFADEMGRLLGPDFPKHIALAVSGGGDSMAMLYLAAPWARVMGIKLYVATINHNLREDAAEEAALVAKACAELGLFHQRLDWHWDGAGNLQDSARQARLELLDRWRGEVDHIFMAHTQDDQAETFLMRLARGSGAEGLAGMAESREVRFGGPKVPLAQHENGPPWPPKQRGSFKLLRPLLGTSRAALRHYLDVLKIDYADDPSNDDPKYDRVKMRQALPALAALGLDAATLAETAMRLSGARKALATRALDAHKACLAPDSADHAFDISYDRDSFARIERDTQLRLLSTALMFVSDAPYRPRLKSLEDALDRALGGGATTLHGGYICPHKATLFIVPEYARIKDLRPRDGYWRREIFVGEKDIRPLGEAGAAQLRDQTDLPARVLWPAPALWEGETVRACPRLGHSSPWRPEIPTGRFERLLTRR